MATSTEVPWAGVQDRLVSGAGMVAKYTSSGSITG